MKFSDDLINRSISIKDKESVLNMLSTGDSVDKMTIYSLLIRSDWFDSDFANNALADSDDDTPVFFELPLLMFPNAYLAKYGVIDYDGDLREEVFALSKM